MKSRSITILCTALSVAAATLLSRTEAFRTYENKTLDSRFRWRHSLLGPTASPEIRLIGIDDQTLVALGGRWPIAWQWHALLLEALSEKLPAVVAYDVLFPSAQGQSESDVEMLARATERLGDVLYPYYFYFEERGHTTPSPYRSPAEIDADRKALRRFEITDVEGATDLLPKTVEATLPIAQLAGRAALGFANAQGDPEDGVVRRMPIVLGFENVVYPSFVLMAVLRYYNIQPEDVHVRLGDRVEFDIPEGPHVSIPIDAGGAMLINYTARHNEFSQSVFVQVVQSFARQREGLATPLNLADFEGKLVLVGVTTTGAIEAYARPAPLDPESPLLIAQANALNTIIDRSFVCTPGLRGTIALLIALGAVVGAITGSLRAATSLALVVLWMAAFIVISYALFFNIALVLPIIPACSMMVLIYTLITSYRYATEERQRRFYRGVLGKYLSRNVMEALLKDPAELKLGGARKDLTVLFADVKGFSKFCETSPVEAISPRLNELHDRMTQIIWKYDGTLDKYIGDCIMAFWGAPLEQHDHARRAVLAAVEMREELARMRRTWELRGMESLAMGIGINTGTMVVGNMGSSDFWDYTVLGDEVNLASRIEGLTRTYGVDVILSEFTYRQAADLVDARLLGEVTVKGRQKPVVIYELVGRKNPGMSPPEGRA